ncbi:PKD domain-containing protein [Bowmanella sp. Y26]|uniref:PKD domain-containing protein n=1 Tax=Bowmanella yangjiangensis TaxID=2811230 RepID=UPI001BDDC514|nr:PKD domain-containing protein [Bowmanella yangjiangensis]MBT1062269.1 PKD domain-containing protein [Bowmanella yangjiangensis]
MKHSTLLSTFALCAVISGCGGGGSGSDSSPTKPVPEPQNNAPVAKIYQPKERIDIDQNLELSGADSYDPDNDKLSYKWTAIGPQGVPAIAGKDDEKILDFVPPSVGLYHITLTVTDSKGASHSTTSTLEVDDIKPILLNIEADQSTQIGELVALYGRFEQFTRLGEAPVAFNWQLHKPEDSQAALEEVSTYRTRFIPDKPGEYKLTLTVNSNGRSAESQWSVWAYEPGQVRPNAKISAVSQELRPNRDTLLKAYSNWDDEPTGYYWSVVNAPTDSQYSLSAPEDFETLFQADLAGEYEIELTVTSGHYQGKTRQMLRVVEGNRAPRVEINNIFHPHRPGEKVTLYAQGKDDDNDNLSYQWRLISKPNGSAQSLVNGDSAEAELTLDSVGDYLVSVTTSDGQLSSAPALHLLSAQRNYAPFATFSVENPRIALNEKAQLDALNTFDSDGDSLQYLWDVIDKPEGANTLLEGNLGIYTQFSADKPGIYLVQLTAYDGQIDSYPYVKAIWVEDSHAPVVEISGQLLRQASLGQTITMDASSSFDVDGDNLSFSWKVLSGPNTEQGQFSDSGEAKASFTPTQIGSYVLQVKVSDGHNVSAGYVNVEVEEQAQAQLTINGRLLDAAGQPVPPLSVIQADYLARSDDTGNFTLQIPQPQDGDWPLSAKFTYIGKGLITSYLDLAQTADSAIALGDLTLVRPIPSEFNLSYCEGYSGDASPAFKIVAEGEQAGVLPFKFYGTLYFSSDTTTVRRALPAPAKLALQVADSADFTATLADGTSTFSSPLSDAAEWPVVHQIKICNK